MYDVGFGYLCSVVVDGAELTPRAGVIGYDPYTGLAIGDLWVAWSIPLDSADTNCGRIKAAVFGTDSIIEHLESIGNWTIGVGPAAVMPAAVYSADRIPYTTWNMSP